MFHDIKVRRLNLGELFRCSGGIYRAKFAFIAAIVAMVYMPLFTLVSLIPQPPIPYMSLSSTDSNAFVDYFAYLAKIYFVHIFFTPLSTAAITYLVISGVEGFKTTFTGIMDASLIKWARLVVTSLLYSIIVWVCSPLVIPGIYFSVLFTFYPNIIALENRWGMSALLRSRGMVHGRWFATFGFILFIALLTLLFNIATSALIMSLGFESGLITNVLISTVVEMFAVYFSIVLSLWFLNNYYLSAGQGESS